VRAETPEAYRKRVSAQRPLAIVIANAGYRLKGVPNAPHAAGGEAAFMTYLQQDMKLARSRIVRLRDPRLRDLEALFGSSGKPVGQLQALLANAKPSEVIIYFAGHALPVDGGKDAVLLPADGDPVTPAETGYRLSMLYRIAHGLGVSRLRVYLDAAFNTKPGARPVPNAPPPTPVVNYPVIGPLGLLTPRHWVTVTAGTGDQPVYAAPKQPLSAFAAALLAGLRGQADLAGPGNRDSAVTARELVAYMRGQVAAVVARATGGTQTPALAGRNNEILAVYDATPVAVPAPAPTQKPAAPAPAPAPAPPAPAPEKKAAPAKPVKPSFDCATARVPAEKAICANPELARLDIEMVDLYIARKRAFRGGRRATLRRQQLQWLGQRNACRSDVACLTNVYQKRIQQLQ